MRRPSSVELMLLTVILLWALNLSVTKYILEHGLEPLSYATARYALAGAIFVTLTLVAERSRPSACSSARSRSSPRCSEWHSGGSG